MSYIFLIITSDSCGHCRSFKEQYFNDMISNLKSVSNLNILHINLPSMKNTHEYFINLKNDQIFKVLKGSVPTINPNIEKAIGWFPEFMLISSNIWNSGGKLTGLVFNGIFNELGLTLQNNTGLSRNSKTICDWVKNSIKDFVEPISNSPVTKDYMPSFVAPTKIKLKITSNTTD